MMSSIPIKVKAILTGICFKEIWILRGEDKVCICSCSGADPVSFMAATCSLQLLAG